MPRRRSILPVAAAALAVVLAGLGVAGLRAADRGTQRHTVRVDGLPLYVVQPSTVEGKLPGVVVAHGFAASAKLMSGFADTLVRRGYVVVLLDFAGHGANSRPLPTDEAARDRALQRDLATAVRHLRSLSTVDPERIALVGHSMGASAVVAYAASDPTIRATVAISLGSDEGAPGNLLVVYGALELPVFRDTAEAALASGRAKRVVEVPGTEHVSVLYSDRTHEETATWLGSAVGGVHPRARLVPGALLLLAFGIGFYPLAIASLGRMPRLPQQRLGLMRFTLASVVGVLAALLLARLFGWLPLAVGNYEAGYFLVLGLILGGSAYRGIPQGPAGSWWWLLIVYAVSAVAVPVHFGLTYSVPVGPRWWLLPVMVFCCGVFLLGAETVSRGRIGRYAVVLVLAVLGLLGGAVLGVAPGFLTLIVPLLVFLLLWQAAWAALLRRLGAPAWLIATVGAVVLAWPTVMALPLAGSG